MARVKPRGVLIAGNWKMNQGLGEMIHFMTELKTHVSSLPMDRKALIFPMAPLLHATLSQASVLPFPLEVGAQNAWGEPKGAFTGELSAPLLKELGVTWALVGHSERRQLFGESDAQIARRVEGLLEQGLRVMLCVGETRGERDANRTWEVLGRQLDAVIGTAATQGSRSRAYLDGRLVIAYEPVWAIGTGLTATVDQAQEAHAWIRHYLTSRCGAESAARTPLLYGGSVTPENVSSLLACEDVDGALVGGASLKATSFAALLGAKS